MIKEKELRNGEKIRFREGGGVDLPTLQTMLAALADKYSIPVAFYNEQIKYGGLIGGSTKECLVLYHPNHKNDYFSFVLQVTYQGRYAFLDIDEIGQSKMAGKVYAAGQGRKDAKAERRGLPMSERVGAAIGAGIANGIMSIGANKSKLEQEENWYLMIKDIIEEGLM